MSSGRLYTVPELLDKLSQNSTKVLSDPSLFGRAASEPEFTGGLLDKYWVHRPELNTLVTGQTTLLSGRQGSGKSALVLQAISTLARDPKIIPIKISATDLKPEELQSALKTATGISKVSRIANAWLGLIWEQSLMVLGRKLRFAWSSTETRILHYARNCQNEPKDIISRLASTALALVSLAKYRYGTSEIQCDSSALNGLIERLQGTDNIPDDPRKLSGDIVKHSEQHPLFIFVDDLDKIFAFETFEASLDIVRGAIMAANMINAASANELPNRPKGRGIG